MKIKSILNCFFLFIIHLVASGAILYSFLPLAKWYFEAKPLWGVDFYYLVTLVSLLKESLVLPPSNWGYAWFSGWPLYSIFPSLNVYLSLFFANFFGLIAGIKILMLTSLALFFIGCYACFYTLSRNIVISLVLTTAAIFSVGVYGTLMWGGSLPNHATQVFFPWVLFFIILYLKNHNFKYLLLSSLLAGVAFWGHPQIVVAYIFPASFLLFLFSFGKMQFIKRLKSLIVFGIFSILIGLPIVYPSFEGGLKSLVVKDINLKVASSTTVVEESETSRGIAEFHRNQPKRIYTDTNTTIFVVLVLSYLAFTIGLLIKRSKSVILDVLPYLILAAYFTFYIWVFGFGISFYHGGWYRLFWTPPFWLGLLVAVFWGVFQTSLQGKKLPIRIGMFLFFGLLSTALLLGGLYSVNFYSQNIKDKIVARSNPSSAFPDVLSLRDDKGLENLKKELTPSWLDPNETNYRLYSGDQTINIWWNALYKMPIARGYLDPPTQRGYLFWVDTALSQSLGTGEDQLVGSFKYPPEIALNNSLFLIDWYSIKYFEVAPSPATFAPIPKSISENYIDKNETLDFNKEKFSKANQILTFLKLKDEYTSPILSSTNASTLGIVSSDSGYETIIRDIADLNFGPKKLIPIKLGPNLDKLSLADLKALDALILYEYKYKDKGRAFRLISEYVKGGKKVFLDTGAEVKESQTDESLPDIFPIEKTYRKALDKAWNFEVLDQNFAKNVDFSKFDPPIFDQADWKLSFPQREGDIREGSRIILKNHGKAVVITQRLGQGKVLWSGLNLPYHVARYHNLEELAFFQKIIEEIVDISEKPRTTFETRFIKPELREIKTSGSRGILFKEQAYPGWKVKIKSESGNKSARIFKAGPAYPGFMYVSLPTTQEYIVTFKFGGGRGDWFLFYISLGVAILMIDYILLGRFGLSRIYNKVFRAVKVRITNWWKREDE